MSSQNVDKKNTLAIALGSNLPSHAGDPISTLIAVRPQVEKVIIKWILSSQANAKDIKEINSKLHWRWSPFFLLKNFLYLKTFIQANLPEVQPEWELKYWH